MGPVGPLGPVAPVGWVLDSDSGCWFLLVFLRVFLAFRDPGAA